MSLSESVTETNESDGPLIGYDYTISGSWCCHTGYIGYIGLHRDPQKESELIIIIIIIIIIIHL